MTLFGAIADAVIKVIGVPLDAYKDGYNRGIDDCIHELKMLRRRM
jgi:hypothetical protein